MQFQADILDCPVLRSLVLETTGLGAAYLAGLGVGFWETQETIFRQWQAGRRFEPAMTPQRRADRLGLWRRAVGRAAAWIA